MAGDTLLLEVGALFTAVALCGLLAKRIGLSVIPFYIIAGIICSPFVVGRLDLPYIQNTEFIGIGAELGIVFLLFFLGLEFNLDRLLESRQLIGKAGLIDLGINFPVGFALGYLFFGDLIAATLLAGIIYISSSAIITKSLIDLGWIANDEANPMLGTLVFEDLFIAVYLAVVSAIVIGGGDIGAAAQSVGIALGFIFLLLLLVQYGNGLFERLLATDSHEYFLLRAVGVTILVAGAALALGVSEAVAAFFIGMAFSSTTHVHELERLLEPIRDLFAAIFFFWIGLITDPLLIVGVAGYLAVAILASTPTKLLSGYWSGRVYELSHTRSVRVGAGMVTRGEFSLIIATVAAAGTGPVLTETIPAFAVGYVLSMSILGTVCMQYSDTFEGLIPDRTSQPEPAS
ncbi:cation:proton antiporter [Halohasta litorea]|uniref:Cation:proton antiporter n=1 Tax=Halohasta litorea TaxID=869891 RepID=A0ABD6D873_9EURY|nr:cation:proton antiporter [Halohasta litorea]